MDGTRLKNQTLHGFTQVMEHNFRTWNEFSTKCVVEELVRQGVTQFFIAPGSRSSPLVLAASENPKVTIQTHFDERGLGFLALGHAKVLQSPVAIITTSGSAVANLLPALVEAHQSHTPLIVLTADRPFELLDNGANQAISQTQIFKDYVCQQISIPESSPKTSIEGLMSKMGFGVYKSKTQKKPLHVNWHFQEPLSPAGRDEKVVVPPSLLKWLNSQSSWTQFAEKISFDSQKGVICAGGFLSHPEQNTILKIAEKLQMPILWDVQNTFRFQVHHLSIPFYDLILDKIQPEADVILHFGGSLTSKRLNSWIEKSRAKYIRIHPELANQDFLNKNKTYILSSYESFLNQMPAQKEVSQLLRVFQEEVKALDNVLQNEFSDLNEMTLPYHLLKETKDCNLFVGSSMPIRDLERFGKTGNVRIFSNRGASGIDGNLATAIGIAQATQIQTLAFVGDLTFLYDLNSLTMVNSLENPFKVIVVNNSGGGIFSFLPISQIQKETFEKYFTTPHDFKFKDCGSFFGMKYFELNSVEDLKSALRYDGHCIMELKSDIDMNVKLHRELTQKYLK